MAHANTTPRRESADGAFVRTTYYVLLTAVESPLAFTQHFYAPHNRARRRLLQGRRAFATGKRRIMLIVRLLLVFCLAKSATGFATTPRCPDACYKGFMDNGGCPFLVQDTGPDGTGRDTDSFIPRGCHHCKDGAVTYCCENGFSGDSRPIPHSYNR